MRRDGTLRVLSGSPRPGPRESDGEASLIIDDGDAGTVSVRTVEGRLLVTGTGSFDVTIGRIRPFRRVLRHAAPVPPLLRQGHRLTVRVGSQTARLQYDPDGLLPGPVRVVAKAARLISAPLWTVPLATAAMVWMLAVASMYYGSMPINGTALELARHRGAEGYERVDTSREALLKGRSPFLVQVTERRKAEKASATVGDAR